MFVKMLGFSVELKHCNFVGYLSLYFIRTGTEEKSKTASFQPRDLLPGICCSHFDYQLDYTYSSSFGAVVTRDRLLIKRLVVRSFNLYVKVSVGKTWIHHGQLWI